MPSGRTMRLIAAALTLAPLPLAAQQATVPPRPTMLGMNVPAISYYANTAPFANLIIGSDWQTSSWQTMPERHTDRDGSLLSLPADNVALRMLSVPPTAGAGIRVRCSFTGSGTLAVFGHFTSIVPGTNSLTFTARNVEGADAGGWLLVRDVRADRPMRNLDCRETSLPATARFRPAALETLRGYSVLRFMDWQNANANAPITWAERHLPTGNRHDRDGIAIEDMLALSAEMGASPWFVVPWNADDDYISRFARLVAERLPRNREVYVEVGNEVWNDGFAVAGQATREGLARGLAPDAGTAKMRRYAERTVEVMRLWEAAFAGRTGLVRVISTQNVNPDTARMALSFRDTAAHVDALATAPYFGRMVLGSGHSSNELIRLLTGDVAEAIDFAQQNREVALRYGKRYVTYEGGQGLVMPTAVAENRAVQYDKRMYDLYRSYLSQWQGKVGDLLTLLTSVAPTNSWGAWGLVEREDETADRAPKLRAVREQLGVRGNGGSPIAKLR